MKIYILFKKAVPSGIIKDQVDIKKDICEITRSVIGGSDISVYIASEKNISADIDIRLDTVIQNTNNEAALLNSYKLTVFNRLKTSDHSLEDAEVRAIIDTNYHPKIEYKNAAPNNIKTNAKNVETNSHVAETDYEERAKIYTPTDPDYTFDRVILPQQVIDNIESSLNILLYENKVFNEWGLKVIQPHPVSALSFFGPSGTGKTMAAEAIANKLHKKILKVSYADIESKFHGEGPKQVKAIFLAAEKNNAVLFIDEADSLLSKRLTNVTDGSGQAINSMRSQLLICLEQFKGIVIFATNLVVNYDQAFRTRLKSVEFILPDLECREKIWNVHILPVNNNGLNIPLAEDVDTKALAEQFEFCGREIRKAVVTACVKAAMENRNLVSQQDFINACETIKEEEASLENADDHTKKVTFTDKEKNLISQTIKSNRNRPYRRSRNY